MLSKLYWNKLNALQIIGFPHRLLVICSTFCSVKSAVEFLILQSSSLVYFVHHTQDFTPVLPTGPPTLVQTDQNYRALFVQIPSSVTVSSASKADNASVSLIVVECLPPNQAYSAGWCPSGNTLGFRSWVPWRICTIGELWWERNLSLLFPECNVEWMTYGLYERVVVPKGVS